MLTVGCPQPQQLSYVAYIASAIDNPSCFQSQHCSKAVQLPGLVKSYSASSATHWLLNSKGFTVYQQARRVVPTVGAPFAAVAVKPSWRSAHHQACICLASTAPYIPADAAHQQQNSPNPKSDHPSTSNVNVLMWHMKSEMGGCCYPPRTQGPCQPVFQGQHRTVRCNEMKSAKVPWIPNSDDV
jgi:hypothetical protein